MVKSINNVLDKTLKNLNLSKKLKEKSVLNIWPEVIGKELVKYTKASYINKGILFVKVNSSTWAHQLLFLKKDLIEKLNNKLDEEIVKDIRFKVGSTNTNNKLNSKRKESFDLDVIDLTEKEISKIEDDLKNISDPEMKEKFYSLMIKDKKLNKLKSKEGWVRCKYCSALHPEDVNECMICQLKKNKNFNKLEQMLLEIPWLDYEEISDIYPNLLNSDYKRIKQRLLNKFWDDIKDKLPKAINNDDQKVTQELKVLIQYYVMLNRGVYPNELNRDIIQEVIGNNYIQIYDQL
ncbi:DUF721 domain-containing protein [Selenihalanaerobacter shriftii]|uniref:DUF721 domain-containing protein n=1 Tax=Selenihalanaerobacter shriftii TaxID=142842 RepID=A0A1T4NKQ9_9FIRM|nr:DUF721 domain-containing protein [Selenihalanaerobacter shriftii]SJZ79607.1 Protein of unknown function [Selenihalanaerobacter shriftii]